MDPSNGNPHSPSTSADNSLPVTSKAAVASFVLGFCSLILSCLAGLPGIVLSIIALVQINKSQGQLKGTGLAVTGLILSAILTPATIAVLVLVGMLLPAVEAAREAAERMERENKARQVTAEPNHQLPDQPKAEVGGAEKLDQ
ncbi:MAG: DUF4190 domain-containing protein [Mariniblastus sp.]|nr:DUF4190 domain-containing protein [Mariniblastus sp.]